MNTASSSSFKRRSLATVSLALCVAFFSIATLATGFGTGLGGRDPGRGGQDGPNIVLIVTDDQRWDTLRYMPWVRRHLIHHGTTFENAFVVNPVCCPSRASILTGRYSHGTGVYTNRPPLGGVDAFDPSDTIATRLQAAGYRTALFGKYLNHYVGPEAPPGWDRWASFNDRAANAPFFDYTMAVDGTVRRYGHARKDYSTDVLADHAERFIDATKGPFFLYLAPSAPHKPSTPAPRDRGSLHSLRPHRPPSFGEADTSDKPAWVQAIPEIASNREDRFDEFRLGQLESLGAVDDAVHRIVRTLRASGEIHDTLFVFTSDNGIQFGEHRLRGKEAPYEESIRVPMVVRYDAIRGRARDERRMVLNIDLAPTFADLAGVRLNDPDGRSIVPLLKDRSPRWRSGFLIEHVGGRIPTYCAVRTKRWKYVYYIDGERELYDLKHDPYELEDLAEDPTAADTTSRLHRRLRVLCSPAPPGWSGVPAA